MVIKRLRIWREVTEGQYLILSEELGCLAMTAGVEVFHRSNDHRRQCTIQRRKPFEKDLKTSHKFASHFDTRTPFPRFRYGQNKSVQRF